MQTRASLAPSRRRLVLDGIPLGRAEVDRHITHTVGFAVDFEALPQDARFRVEVDGATASGVPVSRVELREDNGPPLLACDIAPASPSFSLPVGPAAIHPLLDGVARFDLRLIASDDEDLVADIAGRVVLLVEWAEQRTAA